MAVRLIFMRVLVNGLVMGITALLLPGIRVTDPGLGTLLNLGVVFGLWYLPVRVCELIS